MLKKSLALLLTLVMVLSLAPVSAFAAETTSYDTVQLPATLPKAVSLDGYITQGDGYHSFGIIATNHLDYLSINGYSKSRNYAMLDVAEALLAAQTQTYFFAQDNDNYYFGVKIDRKSVNVDGYNYYTSQQNMTFNIGFKEDSYITVTLPLRADVEVGTSETVNLKASDSEIQKGLKRGALKVVNGESVPSTDSKANGGAVKTFFSAEPTYNITGAGGAGVWSAPYSDRVKTDVRNYKEGLTIGVTGKNQMVGATVFTYEFSITKESVKTYLGATEAPSSIYFSASSTDIRYGSMNDLTLATMSGVDCFDATFTLGSNNAPTKVTFEDPEADHEHEYVENPIDSFLVNKANWVAGSYYHAVHPTSNMTANSSLRCGQAPEYYVSCSICRAAGTDTFYGEVKQHSFVIRGDIVSSEITACDAENPSRLTYEYKCAWCDETAELPLGDYIHNYKDLGKTVLNYTNRYYSECANANCVYLKTKGEPKLAAWYKCTSTHEIGTATFGRTTDIAATCTTPAVTVYECAANKNSSYCQYTVTKTTDAAKGHTADLEKTYDVSVTASEVDKAPTCEGKGVYFKTCSVCGAIDETSEHFYVDPSNVHDEATKRLESNEVEHWVACDKCKGVGSKTEEHSFDREIVASDYLKEEVEPTCQKTYYKSCVCGVGSTNEEDTFKVPTGDVSLHDYSENYFHNAIYHWRECTTCGATNMPTYHTFNGVSCIVCKYKKASVPSTPVTEAPTTEAPTTEAPATEAPTTEAPATEAPATEAPTTEAPTTEAPATETPATEAPATEAPATEAPATEAPATEAPATAPVEGGCGASVTFVGLALVATLGTCTAFVAKKKED